MKAPCPPPTIPILNRRFQIPFETSSGRGLADDQIDGKLADLIRLDEFERPSRPVAASSLWKQLAGSRPTT